MKKQIRKICKTQLVRLANAVKDNRPMSIAGGARKGTLDYGGISCGGAPVDSCDIKF
ncbi:MAG TPA: hypothetical protein VD993_17795 [Chitinophagaceae bacterium]|nr:hypothetical protein [Chitinophagaceae bacterium]